jgi:AbrB family looped-hinge helix DNA binding protein
MVMSSPRRRDPLSALTTTSAKIRSLAAEGVSRADIARKLDIRYQHVRNVLEHDRMKEAKAVVGNVAAAIPGEASASLKTKLGPDGRVVIPAAFRESLGLKDGDVLFARLENGEIVLLTPRAAMLRAQAIVRRFVPDGVSLVDELIEDRRREAKRESEDD